jgi:ferredoxin
MSKTTRKIISIDEEKCDGCGLCIPSCAEGALQVVDGKARLVKDVFCDGLGNCLGECPQGAIEIIEREAEPFDEKAVEKHLERLEQEKEEPVECEVCCGSSLIREIGSSPEKRVPVTAARDLNVENEAELSHWPIQLHLVSPQSRFLQGVDLLIAADCVPFAHADFHSKFLAGRSLIICCPKLDDVDVYHRKLVEIFKHNKLRSIMLVHMEVGCCFGLSRLIHSALEEAAVDTPIEEIIINIDGSIKKPV